MRDQVSSSNETLVSLQADRDARRFDGTKFEDAVLRHAADISSCEIAERRSDGSSGPVCLPKANDCHTNKVPCHTDLEERFVDFLDGAKDVVRHFKNERLRFSVCYSEGPSSAAATFPDFIIAARESAGREVMCLAETKGEMRLNTPLKSEAARAWCEKMSGTRYDQWRFLFLQQKKPERILAAGVSSLAELAESPAAGTGRASTEAALASTMSGRGWTPSRGCRLSTP